MTDEDYSPLLDREREPKSRIHDELTEPARERLYLITKDKGKSARVDAVKYLRKRVGTSPFKNYLVRDISSTQIKGVRHERLVRNSDTLHVLTYIELIMREHHKQEVQLKRSGSTKLNRDLKTYEPKSETKEAIEDIRDVLITEGILWDVRLLGEGGIFEFTPIESEGLEQLDEQIQEFAEDQPWAPALKGYNAAFERYLRGEFDEQIPKKLYYSIEEVLKTICVDEENWTENRELSHSDYLKMLNENGVYDAHGVTASELGDLLNALERMVAKIGDDRSQRHAYQDRTYATLLIHQVGAYLYFLINRYKQYSS